MKILTLHDRSAIRCATVQWSFSLHRDRFKTRRGRGANCVVAITQFHFLAE